MENKRIITTELDFDAIKVNIKEYLKGQDEFQDFDFEGSAMNILLDVLAYNTHYNALYTNMAVNESFIDSASKRSSVVSKAKELGYIPSSARCAEAIVNIVIETGTTGGDQTLELPKYTPFTTQLNKITYLFYTTETIIAYKTGTTFTFTNVKIKEGNPLVYSFTASNTQKYILPNINVDLNTVLVSVRENATSTFSKAYSSATSLLDVNSTSEVYFVKEIDGQLYELEFGNGVIGKALESGNVVQVEYMTCNTTVANGIRNFTYAGENEIGTVTVNTVVPAQNGSEVEDVDSIKWNAPRAYTAQNRCVTAEDYKSVIFALFPTAQAISVWGGEDNVPVSYGDVYISIKPKDKDALTQDEKNFILNDVLRDKKMVTIHPKLVDPIALRLDLDVAFYYNPRNTARTAGDLTSLVRNTIIDYNDSNLNRFNGVFKYSNLSSQIDNTEPSIVSNIVTVKLERDVEVIFNGTADYSFSIGNPIYNSGVPEEAVKSNAIRVQNTTEICYIDDVPTEGSDVGQLRLYYLNNNEKVLVKYVGTVTYSTGIISINDLVITDIVDSVWTFVFKPQSNDVVGRLNHIINIDEFMLTITPVIERDATSYRFTSSRN